MGKTAVKEGEKRRWRGEHKRRDNDVKMEKKWDEKEGRDGRERK